MNYELLTEKKDWHKVADRHEAKLAAAVKSRMTDEFYLRWQQEYCCSRKYQLPCL